MSGKFLIDGFKKAKIILMNKKKNEKNKDFKKTYSLLEKKSDVSILFFVLPKNRLIHMMKILLRKLSNLNLNQILQILYDRICIMKFRNNF